MSELRELIKSQIYKPYGSYNQCKICGGIWWEDQRLGHNLSCTLFRMEDLLNSLERMEAETVPALKERAEKAEERVEQLEEGLHRVANWAKAYPLVVFPEPDFHKAADLLEAGGMTIDAISASNMRHVVTRVSEIAADALKKTTEAES